MTIGERIKMLREQKGMTQDELANRVGYKHKTSVNKIETGERKLMMDKILVFAKALDTTPEAIMGWDNEEPAQAVPFFSREELNIMNKYRALDKRGRNVVEYILDEEYARISEVREVIQYASENYAEPGFKIFPFVGEIAAAGTAIYPGDIPIEYLKERKLNGADFIIQICGDSMEPTFYDHERLYVQKTTHLEFGDIGLFIVNGYYYVKELAPNGLHSHNPNYDVIPKDREIIVVGKVLGKVE